MTKVLGQATHVTTNDYVTLLEIDLIKQPHISKLSVEIHENNVNAIKYTIEGTIDDVNWEEIKAETIVAKDGNADITPTDAAKLGDPWSKVRVQHKASVGAAQGNTTATIVGF